MEQFANEQRDEAKNFTEFYIDLIENNKPSIKYYLANNVTLDWFGKTIKGDKKVALFLKDTVSKTGHNFPDPQPTTENVAFRDTHKITLPITEEECLISSSVVEDENQKTPPKATTSTNPEMADDDNLVNADGNLFMSPRKKIKLDLSETNEQVETVEDEKTTTSNKLKFITSEGFIEFHRPSVKKLQTETKWKRPCKLHFGYTCNYIKDCTIYLIIYEGHLKCKRNLYKDFCQSSND